MPSRHLRVPNGCIHTDQLEHSIQWWNDLTSDVILGIGQEVSVNRQIMSFSKKSFSRLIPSLTDHSTDPLELWLCVLVDGIPNAW